MTQPNQFRYTLAVRGLFNYVIPEAPKGWEGSLITFDRSESYYGMIRTFTIPMDFVLDGAKILRTEFYQYGLAGRVEFVIEELNNSDWTYSEIYRGDIDFSTVVDASSLEGYTFTVNVMEGGISAAIKAYENQVYEIPVNVPEAIDIQLTPILLTETADLIFIPNIDHRSDAFFGLQVVNNQQNSVTPSVQDSGFVVDSAASFDGNNDNFFYKATVDTDIRVQGNLKGNVSTLPGGAKRFQVNVYKSDNILVATLYDVTTNFGTFDFSWDFTTSMLKDERLFFYFKNVTDNNTNVGFQVTDGTLSLAYQTITPASMCKALRPKYVFDKLIELMNDAVYPTLSYHLDTAWPQLTITCGDAIRQITDAKIKISFKDFFQSINSVTNAGFGIQNDTAVLEAKGYFYQNVLQSMDVGNVQDAKLSMYEAYIYNSVKIGYPDQTYDVVNGKDEPNSEQNYSLPIIRIAKELNLMSVIRADSYGIEFIRIQGNTPETTKSDNDPFFVMIRDTPESGHTYYQPIQGEAFTSITGLAGGSSVYNLLLTPKRNLVRHGDYLHGILDKYDGYLIKFTSGLKNTAVSTVGLDGIRYTENSNYSVSALADKLFLPYLVDITTKLPRDAYTLIRSLPGAYISYTLDGNSYRGFIISAGVDVAKNTPREFKLLLTKDNNLLNLVR